MPRGPDRGCLILGVLLLVVLQRETGCSTGTTSSAKFSKQKLCEPGLEFWSIERATCSPCTTCAPEFTLSPCAIHKDAICGPLSALELDWSFLSRRKRPEEDHAQRRFEEFLDLANLEDQRPRDLERRIKTSGNDERILWDWQTGALILAVCACVLFFLVAGCSALVYARQWRRMKKNFEPAGLEEISARLNLMVKAELAELVAGAPMNPGDPETRCQYLEKLLDRKRETPMMVGWSEVGGNLYIEEGEPSKGKKSQIARIHRNIETILSQKRNSGD